MPTLAVEKTKKKFIEYKRYRNWDEIFEDEKKEVDKLKAEKKLRPVAQLDEVGLAVEVALNRIGEEGWELCYVATHGIYFMRNTQTEPTKKTVNDVLGLPKTMEKEKKENAETSSEVPA